MSEPIAMGHSSGKWKLMSSTRRREMVGVLLLAVGLFVGLSLVALQLGSRSLMGPCGAAVGLGLYALVGVGGYLMAAGLLATAVACLRGRTEGVRPRAGVLAAAVGVIVSSSVLLHLALRHHHRLHGYAPGGLVGEYGAEVLGALLGTVGTLLLALTGLALSLLAATPLSLAGVGRLAAVAGRAGLAWLRGLWTVFGRAAVTAFPAGGTTPRAGDTTKILTHQPALRVAPRPTVDETGELVAALDKITVEEAPPPVVIAPTRRRRKREDEAGAINAGAAATISDHPALPVAAPPLAASAMPFAAAPVVSVPQPVIADADRTDASPAPTMVNASAGASTKAAASDVTEPAIVLPPRDLPTAAAIAGAFGPPALATLAPRITPPPPPAALPPARTPATMFSPPPPTAPRRAQAEYRFPDVSLLDFDDPAHGDLDRQAMLDLAVRLERTLADYGVKGRVSEIHPGPVVTMYEFVPQAGTKLSKITSLSSDLAMALEALKVRIVAPIPGKAAVGIEVPNKTRETVYLKEIVADENFQRAKSKLTIALGKDIAGRPTTVDLARMPHLLVAGTTGSGKSVSVNGMIMSLLFRASPDDVKLLMIDPKMLELSIYEGIPHLLLPVVTDPKKANLALRWAVDEMERRYDLISKSGVRDIASYNKKLARLAGDDGEGGVLPPPKPEAVRVKVTGPDGVEREVDVETLATDGSVTTEMLEEISAARVAMQQKCAAPQQEPAKKLPYIVVIIDEFADLMMVASKEVETSVARIAQKARAAGIHLLLATQRPSVDVITGLIKANFPSRIAFQVAQKVDARTILDQQGAENLLGMGDMLFMDRGAALQRIHGPLVTDVEIKRVVDFLKEQGKPVYDLDILKPRLDDDEGMEPEDMSDEMYDQAVALVTETRQVSVSMLQRRLRVGYNRSARMVERMERDGIVGPADGTKPREVLASHHAA